ncbi:MAG TPA: hypothetical protein VFJ16_04115 [Longimicrobium sp.]|nr:hypothetical protein [Longimicrobium sp.]
MLGAGCWVLGAGCWVLGAGCWVLGVILSAAAAPFRRPHRCLAAAEGSITGSTPSSV